MIRDAFSTLLSSRAQGFKVIDVNDLQDILQKERLSVGLLYTGELGELVSRLAHADGCVSLSIDKIVGSVTALHAELLGERGKKPFSVGQETRTGQTAIRVEIALSRGLMTAPMHPYSVPLRIPVAKSEPNAAQAPLHLLSSAGIP
jgi:hypothetical protein